MFDIFPHEISYYFDICLELKSPLNCFYTRKPVNLQGKRWQTFDYALFHAGVDEIGENQNDGPPLDLKMAGRMFEMLHDDFDNTQDNDNVEDYEEEEELTQPKRFIPNLIPNASENELLVYL